MSSQLTATPQRTTLDRFAETVVQFVPDAVTASVLLLLVLATFAFSLGNTPLEVAEAYYKGFWADPPNCTVGEPGFRGTNYRGENALPLILQNIHRYFLYVALAFLGFLSYDVWLATRFPVAGGGTEFGIGLGTVILAAQKNGEPKQRSGKQEWFENVLNDFIFRAR